MDRGGQGKGQKGQGPEGLDTFTGEKLCGKMQTERKKKKPLFCASQGGEMGATTVDTKA